jgi:hypothetical protein
MPTKSKSRPKTEPETRPVTFTTAPAIATVENGALIIKKSGFPLHPIYDQLVVDHGGDPAQRPVLSMRARAEARAAMEARSADELVWLFERGAGGDEPPAA